MKIYQNYIDKLLKNSKVNSESRFAANQLLEMHKEISKRENPLIVELGVDKGQSTRVFLNAISSKINAKLISVDIKNCKDAVKSTDWEFVQQDSVDIKSLLLKKPIIKFIKVVLPDPELPIIPIFSPFLIFKFIFSKIVLFSDECLNLTF